jgi:hypothetical protein
MTNSQYNRAYRRLISKKTKTKMSPGIQDPHPWKKNEKIHKKK